jgi:hypothetical protein
LILSVPAAGYSRNASCSVNLKSIIFILLLYTLVISWRSVYWWRKPLTCR